jgi:hypothetical protein
MSDTYPDPLNPRKGDTFVIVEGGPVFTITAVGDLFALADDGSGEQPVALSTIATWTPTRPLPTVPDPFRLFEFNTGSEQGWSTVRMSSSTGRRIRVRDWVEVGDGT